MTETEPRRVLFLCSGNYYRSRFAELFFNHLAEAEGLSYHADSAGLSPACHTHNPGPISPHPALLRAPRDVVQADIERAAKIGRA